MPKILYIDPIVKGYRNFLRLDPEFKKSGCITLLVHTSSFYETDYKKEEKIEGLHIRDISFYNTRLIRNVILIEKPDIIIMDNLSFIYDRAIVNISKKNKIKLVYLSHGTLINPETYSDVSHLLNEEIKNKPGRIFSRKNWYVLLNYLDSQYKQNKVKALINLIKGIIKSPSQYLTFAKYEDELDVDLILVYINDDKKHLTENMNFPESKIRVVGNPEISSFMKVPLIDKADFIKNYINIESDRYVVYLDDGLVTNNRWNKDEWYEHLFSIAEDLKKYNLFLVVKLHPRMTMEAHTDFLKKLDNVKAFIDVDFKNLLYHSEFVISHYSSTIIYALMFDKVVIVPKWGKSKDMNNKYPKETVFYCNSIDEFNLFLQSNNFVATNKEEIENYLSKNEINRKIDSVLNIVEEILK